MIVNKLRNRFLLFYLFVASISSGQNNNSTQVLYSPDKTIKVEISNVSSTISYSVIKNNELLVYPSKLGIVFNAASFYDSLEIVHVTTQTIDNSYTMISGKRAINHDWANEMTLEIRNRLNETMFVNFRVYNDGVTFNYEIKEKGKSLVLKDEKTEFHINPNGVAWMQAYDWWAPAYEKEFDNKIRIGTLASKHREDGWSYPALFNVKEQWMLITETGLDANYCATHIRNDEDSSIYKTTIATKEQGYKGGILNPELTTPWKSPWRVIILGSLPLVFESNLVFNVADESKVADTKWIKPGRSSWSWLYETSSPKDFNALKKYVDLAAEMKWEYSLVDANWNMMRNGTIQELIKYANTKNVGLFLWYNSGGAHNKVTEQPRDIMSDPELRRAEFKKLKDWGVKGVKIDFFESDKQDIIRLYIDILEDAAANNIMVNFHGCTLPRGWQRTYPNLVSMEAVKGAEFFLMDKAFTYNAARHNAILPFTRNVIGSMDYTPVTFSNNVIGHVTSFAHELALTVVFESAAFHFGDKAESYRSMPQQVIQFMQEVPTTWDDTKLLSGYPGKSCVVARKKGSNWYIGGVNGFYDPSEIDIDLSFLGQNKYKITIIKDGVDSHTFDYESITYPETKKIKIKVLSEGGFVMKISPI